TKKGAARKHHGTSPHWLFDCAISPSGVARHDISAACQSQPGPVDATGREVLSVGLPHSNLGFFAWVANYWKWGPVPPVTPKFPLSSEKPLPHIEFADLALKHGLASCHAFKELRHTRRIVFGNRAERIAGRLASSDWRPSVQALGLVALNQRLQGGQ